MFRQLLVPFAGVTGGLGYTAYANRPQEHLPEFAHTGLYSPATPNESWWLRATREVAIGSVTVLSKFFIEYLNDFQIVGNLANHRFLMDQIHLGSEHRKRALITVSNHTSVFDDPVLQCSIVGFVPSPKHRWGVCKQQICFRNEFVASFTSAGKVLPIEVGRGLEQAPFKAVGRRLADGDWVHIYPEACCNQSGHLGCERAEQDKARIGRLKWGVGKLVGKLPVAPVIIPYYHVGMEQVKPQDGTKAKALVDPWYVFGRTGKRIRVLVGEPVYVQDLLDEFQHVRRVAEVDPLTGEFRNWDGFSQAESDLYNRITRRVEAALLELEREARKL